MWTHIWRSMPTPLVPDVQFDPLSRGDVSPIRREIAILRIDPLDRDQDQGHQCLTRSDDRVIWLCGNVTPSLLRKVPGRIARTV